VKSVFSDGTKTIVIKRGVYETEEYPASSINTWKDLTYQVEEDGKTMEITDADVQFNILWGTVRDLSLSATFAVNASWTNNTPVVVSTSSPLGGVLVGESPAFTRGKLSVTTSTGDRLALSADSGMQDSALITLELGDSVNSFFVKWDELIF